jgi:threonine dehydratase
MQDLTPDVDAAVSRLRGVVIRTPLIPSPWLSDVTGADVWLKLEALQLTGSFKMRGAYNALAALRERDPAARVVTAASAGNHGLALATAAARLGFSARVHLPKTAPQTKRRGLERAGAEVVEAETYDAAEAAVQADVARSGAAFISAYSHSDVIAGAGTIALEMLADQPALDLILAPVGGGGLISGLAIAARARTPSIEIVGVEAAASPVFTAALAAGRPVAVDVLPTLADGLAGNMEPESQTFGFVRDLVSRVERVDEPAIARAMGELVNRERLIVEGASAVPVAALLAGSDRFAGRRIGIVLTGRNVDPGTLARVR